MTGGNEAKAESRHAMKSIFRNIITRLLRPWVAADPDAPPYEYPNEADSNLEEAVASIWKWYERLDRQVQIKIQGMGGTLEQYHIEDAVFKEGVLSWKAPADPDRIEIHSEAEFQQCFLEWVKRRVKLFADTGELAFGVYALDDERLRED